MQTYAPRPFGYRRHLRKIRAFPRTRNVMKTPASDQGTGLAQVHTEGHNGALPVAPAMNVTLDATRMPRRRVPWDRRILRITAVAIVLEAAAVFIAALLTNLAF